MKLPLLLFALLLGMCAIIGIALLSEPPDNNHGVTHPRFAESMLHGGDGRQRHESVRWLGLAYGALQIVFFVSCLVLGIREPSRCKVAFVLCGVVYLATFCLMVVADRSYVVSENPELFLGFPLPTAMMLYGLSGAPLLFLLIYVVQFDRWILNPEELQRFEELLREKRERKGSGQ